jgi:hypothetical protein
MTAIPDNWRTVTRDALRLLSFRSTGEELRRFGGKHLAFGLLCTWAVGMGRYWDNPRASLPQHFGIGSVAYIFILALLLWVVALPLRPKSWTYFRVLTFVSLVSPPAILYAIPVERAFSLGAANSLNAWFLGLVAAWRVALLFFYLRRLGALSWVAVVAVSLLPLALMVVALTLLNLERVVFDFMGGFRDRSPNDTAYVILFALSVLSFYLFVPLLICYIILAATKKPAAQEKIANPN